MARVDASMPELARCVSEKLHFRGVRCGSTRSLHILCQPRSVVFQTSWNFSISPISAVTVIIVHIIHTAL